MLAIEDAETSNLVSELATRLGVTEEQAVKTAVAAQLERLSETPSFRERLLAFYREHPLPPPTGLKADKAFFDELSGEPL